MSNERLSFIEKFYIFYSILICATIVGSILCSVIFEIKLLELLILLIFIIVAEFLIGHFVINTIHNMDICDIQAQVAITQAQLMSMTERKEPKPIGFCTEPETPSEEISEDSEIDTTNSKLRFRTKK